MVSATFDIRWSWWNSSAISLMGQMKPPPKGLSLGWGVHWCPVRGASRSAGHTGGTHALVDNGLQVPGAAEACKTLLCLPGASNLS